MPRDNLANKYVNEHNKKPQKLWNNSLVCKIHAFQVAKYIWNKLFVILLSITDNLIGHYLRSISLELNYT